MHGCGELGSEGVSSVSWQCLLAMHSSTACYGNVDIDVPPCVEYGHRLALILQHSTGPWRNVHAAC